MRMLSFPFPSPCRLSVEQVDVLWDCLASDGHCSDDLFTWFLAQCRWGGSSRSDGGEQQRPHHALGPKTLEHLYLRKLPTLKPESMGMTALALLQRLCDLAHPGGNRGREEEATPGEGDGSVGMDHMWKIALRADSTGEDWSLLSTVKNQIQAVGNAR
jgi:ubiquitin carboxyl-terminal hydrolase 34